MSAHSIPKTAPRRCRLLYVESDPASLGLAQQIVAGRRHLVLVTAADMDAALKLARRERPEVMLVNLELVGVGAAGLIQILRANPATQTTPILALGNEAPGAAAGALEAGFFLYLPKPLQAGPLNDALDFALEFSSLERAEL